MKNYKKNPKTEGSGIICSIPQIGICPNNCEDCFFQSGRSYLEPLKENLPNLPETIRNRPQVVRINDGNDSNSNKEVVIDEFKRHNMAFFNTAIPDLNFPGPVVLTANPGKMTDQGFHRIDDPPKNLMFVRFRTNLWNLELGDGCINYYTTRGVPVILTFMAYFKTVDNIPEGCQWGYIFRKRTLNSYSAITTEAWRKVMKRYESNKWVHSCGKIEGELGDTHCRFCGNCLREYFATITRMGQSQLEIKI